MNIWLIGALGFLAGGVLSTLFFLMRRGALQSDYANTKTRAELFEQNNREQADEISQLRRELGDLKPNLAAQEERLKVLQEAEQRLRETFQAMSAEALKGNTEQFIKLADQKLNPFKELLDKQNKAVGEIESKREKAYAGIDEKIQQIARSHEKLGTETANLVTALRRPEQRGRWGELQLRNSVELAGMLEHCDFHLQPQTDDPETRDRPDMTVNLPGGGVIVVDSKVALDAYLDSIHDGADREPLLKRHAGQVGEHVRKLAQKKYWDQFESTPKMVVLFMPLESALVAALEVQPHLHAEALRNHVFVATPSLLIALLQAVAYGWQQEAVARNAREIARAGRDLYDRVATFVGHFEEVGKHFARSVKAYNASVGSLEHNLLPGARKLKELHATNESDIASPLPIDRDIRHVVSTELKPLPDVVSTEPDRSP